MQRKQNGCVCVCVCVRVCTESNQSKARPGSVPHWLLSGFVDAGKLRLR